MLFAYLRIALRTTRRHGLYSALNVFGLAVGMAAFLFIVAFMRFELSYDDFHEKADRTFRVVKEDRGNYYLGSNRFAVTPAGLADAMVAEIPGVETAISINDWEALLTHGDTSFLESGLIATGTFFDVFSFPLLRGDPRTALVEPGSIVLTSNLARRLFGEADPMGGRLRVQTSGMSYDVEVRAIVDDVPSNSHLAFEYVVSMATIPEFEERKAQWGNNSYYSYAVLRADADESIFLEQVADLSHRHLQGSEWYTEERRTTLIAQRLTDIHLRSHVNFELTENGDIRYVLIAGLMAVLLLLIPCTNYMNLATARAATRAREVGVRKASGAGRSQLVAQFLGESVVIAFLSLVLAIVFLVTAHEAFNALVDRDIPVSTIVGGWGLAIAAAAALVVGIVSGSYPAFVLSRPAPAAILRGETVLSSRRSHLRNGLVVAQFTIGIALIFATLTIHRQMKFIETADTGMNRSRIVALHTRDAALSTQWNALATELERVPGISAVTGAGHLPTNVGNQNGIDEWDGKQEGQTTQVYTSDVGYGYVPMLGLRLVAGRDFSRDFPADVGTAVLLNETAVAGFGWDDPIGKHFSGPCQNEAGCTVVGVVADYHFHSFRQQIAPLALVLDPETMWEILLAVSTDDLPATIERVGAVWKRFSPAYPLEYQFLDDAFDRMYRSDRRLANLVNSFTALALLISCMGLFGLAAFMAQQRTKEIGVRKVLGAGVTDIVLLLSRDFTRLVAVAVVVGSPVAYFAVSRWLEGFAYRVEIGWGTFVWAALLALAVGWLTVAWQAFRAAMADPVRSLRYE